MDLSPVSILNRRTFTERTFSKMDAGSVRGSIFALCCSAIGAGVLSLPYVLRLCGWGMGIIYIAIGALAGVWSNRLLVYRACEYNLVSYSKLCKKAGGAKLERLLNVSILLYVIGALIGYQIMIASMLSYSVVEFGVDKDFAKSKTFATIISVPVSIFILFPLCIMRDLSSLRYVSIASLGALIYTVIILSIELPSYYRHFSKITDSKPFYFDLNLFTGSSMVFFSYTCQIQTLPIYNELKNPSLPRMNKVINRALFVDMAFYMSIACVGFFSQFDYTDPIVLERILLPGQTRDIPVVIALITNLLCLICAFPANYNPLRLAFFTQVMGRNNFSNKENLIFTTLIITFSCVFSILFPNI